MSDTCKREKFLGFLKKTKIYYDLGFEGHKRREEGRKKGGSYEVLLCCQNCKLD
jgi:hypothetical protein